MRVKENSSSSSGVDGKRKVWMILLLLTLPSWIHCTLTRTRIKLNPKTGGYENISVVISSDLPPEKCPQILDEIKFSLTEASRSLHQSLDERVFFGTIEIVVPEEWTASHCQTPLSDAHPKSSKIGDIVIGIDHPIKKSSPWTQQSLGCSKPGDFIYIPQSFLTHNRTGTPLTHRQKGQAIRDQWLRYRYGVFSSIDSDHYNSVTSTHHALCQGVSVSNIIRTHSDMIGHNSKRKFEPPIFRVSRTGSPKYIIVLENSKAIDDGNHWDFIRTALKKFLKKDLPDYAQVGLVLFNDGARIAETVERLNSTRKDIALKIPRKFSLSPNRGSCIRCGVIKAIESLQTTGTTVGASVIIVSQGKSTSLSNLELDELLNLSTKHRLQIFSVAIPSSPQSDVSLNLELLAHETGGLSFFIPDEPRKNNPSLRAYVGLVEAFREIQSRTTNDGPYLIHEVGYPAYDGSDKFESGSFVIDKFIGRDTAFNVFAMHPGYSKNGFLRSVNIQDRRGDISDTLVDDQETFHILSVHNVHFQENQNIGMNWTYTLQRMPSVDGDNSHFVRVTSKPRIKGEEITVVFFTNIDEHSIKVNPKNPIKLFAEVKLNRVPVMDASVVAEIQTLNQSGYLTPPMRIVLLDNGNGDPDVESNDGIYSRYLTDFSAGEGRYTVTIFVDDNQGRAFSFQSSVRPSSSSYCCNRVEDEDVVITNQKLGTFSRVLKGNSFRIPSIPDDGLDRVPPSRILDLKVDVLSDSQELEFVWTAPGDDFDSGKVTSYLLYSCGVAEQLYTGLNSTQIVDGFSASKIAGERETHRVPVTEFDRTLYYALVALDDSGNIGKVSNIRQAYVPSPAVISSDEEILLEGEMARGGRNSGIRGRRVFGGGPKPDKALLYIVVGIVGFIVICVILILIIVLSYRRKKITHSDHDLSSVNSIDNMKSTGVSTAKDQEEESTHSPGYSVVCDEQDLMKQENETKRFLESTALVVNSSSSTQFSSGIYQNQLSQDNNYGYVTSNYGWTEMNNPYVTSNNNNTLPSYRDYQNSYVPNYTSVPMYAKPIPKSKRIPNSYSECFGLPIQPMSTTSGATTNTLLLSQQLSTPNTPTKGSEELLIVNTGTPTKETKSILKKPKILEEQPSSASSSTTTNKDLLQERSSQSSQVSFSDRESPSNEEDSKHPPPGPPSPSDNVYLETSFEFQEQQKQQSQKKVPPPTLPKPKFQMFENSINGSVSSSPSNIVLLDNNSSSSALDKRVRNITQV